MTSSSDAAQICFNEKTEAKRKAANNIHYKIPVFNPKTHFISGVQRELRFLFSMINLHFYESSLQSVGRREGLTTGEIDWEVSATEKDG